VRQVSRRGGGGRGRDPEVDVREKYVIVKRGDGDVICIVGVVGTRLGNGESKVLCGLSVGFGAGVKGGLFADFGSGVGGGVYSERGRVGTARCWALVDELCDEEFVWLVEASEASRPPTK
jgi:hypothetical protein